MKAFKVVVITLVAILVGTVCSTSEAAASAARKPNCTGGYVALTYDDGPSPVTWNLVSALSANGLRATFFVMGSKATIDPATLQYAVASGNAIGNHTMTHPDLVLLTQAQIKAQLVDTTTAIRKATGVKPTLFRPPYGSTNALIRRVANNNGMTEVGWTVDTNDWRGLTNDQILATIAAAPAGSVILMHDDSQQDIDLVPLIAQILAGKNLCAGKIVSSNVEVFVWPGFTYYAKVVKF